MRRFSRMNKLDYNPAPIFSLPLCFILEAQRAQSPLALSQEINGKKPTLPKVQKDHFH